MGRQKIKNKRIKLGITLPEKLINEIKKIEESEMINKSKLIERLLKEYMNDNQSSNSQ